MTSAADLKNWTKPEVVLRASGEKWFYNTAVCRGKDKCILLYETNDSRWKPFTFRYMESTDLKNWHPIKNAIYGTKKYVGGPALYYEGDYYYTLYLQALRPGYETRITRSKDLVNLDDAPAGRPFVTFDSTLQNLPLRDPSFRESNASDVKICYFKGETVLYFTGSDQLLAGDLQRATYTGTTKDLFEYFFREASAAPEHEGTGFPCLSRLKKQQMLKLYLPLAIIRSLATSR